MCASQTYDNISNQINNEETFNVRLGWKYFIFVRRCSRDSSQRSFCDARWRLTRCSLHQTFSINIYSRRNEKFFRVNFVTFFITFFLSLLAMLHHRVHYCKIFRLNLRFGLDSFPHNVHSSSSSTLWHLSDTKSMRDAMNICLPNFKFLDIN